MSIRQRVQNKPPAFKGQKSALPIESYGIESAEQIKNFYLHNNQLNQSPGSSVFVEALRTETGGIKSIIPFNDLILVQRNQKVTLGLFVAPGTDTFQDIFWSLNSVKRINGAAWRSRLFVSNTQDAFQAKYSYTVSGGSWGLSIGVSRFGL